MAKTIILTAVGSIGDIHPLVALGQALQKEGHHPILIVNEHYRSLVEQNGLEFLAMGDEAAFIQVTQNPDLWHPTKSFQVLVNYAIAPYVRPLYDILAQFDPDNTIVVSSAFLFGAGIAHEKLGMPWVTLHLQPVLFRSVYDTPVMGGTFFPGWTPHAAKRAYFGILDSLLIDRAINPHVNPLRQELGLTPQKRFFGTGIHSPQKSIGLFPDWFAPPQPDWPPHVELTGFVRYDGGDTAVLPDILSEFLDAGEPPLIFTAGTAMLYGADFFQTSLAATQQIGRRAIFVSRDAAQIPANLPETILHVDYVPFSLLLHHAAALIHHGGIGTVAQGLASGIPQLVMPMSHDQPDNARRLKELGVGEWLVPKLYQKTAVAQYLDEMTNSAEVKAACQKWAQQVDFDRAVQQTCQAIVGL